MGKGKVKKKAKPPAPNNTAVRPDTQHDDTTPNNRAMDGHNVEGWTASQVTAYNELLVEREKLVKQRKELEQRSAKSQAGRALLNENVANIDSVFEQQKSSGEYKFVGKNQCCVDIDSDENCHHEICKRAKTNGLTYKELDIIKLYHMRIISEKSSRMRNALRKQRDLELIKIKKDEEERTKTTKKQTRRSSSTTGDLSRYSSSGRHGIAAAGLDNDLIAGATRETQRLVTNILGQLDHLRTELQNGQITNSEMQKQLDIIDAEMHSAQLQTANFPDSQLSQKTSPSIKVNSTSRTSFQNHIAQHLVSAKGDTYTKAFHIMEHFLSASKPGDFQRAVTDLKNVLGLSGPMCDELQSSFDALEGIFDNPDRLSFTGPDGKHECTSIIDLMQKMKETLQNTGQLPEGANADLTRVFQQCIDLEEAGISQLEVEFKQSLKANYGADLSTKLSDIRAAVVSKSPIPPLTEKVLGEKIAATIAKHDVLMLIGKARSGIETPAFDGFLTSFVMSRSNKDPQKCLEIMQQLAITYAELKPRHDCPMVEEAFPRLEAKIRSFFAKLTEKKAKEIQSQQTAPLAPALPQPDLDDGLDILDKFPNNTADIVTSAMMKLVDKDRESKAHLPLKNLIKTYGASGLWPIWLMYSGRTTFFEDTALQEKSRRYEDEIDRIMSTNNGDLTAVIVFLYKSGVCPGMTAAIVSEVLAGMAEVDPVSTNNFLHELSGCVSSLPPYINPSWSTTFQRLALGMLRLYVALHVNATAQFPELQSADFALSTVAMMTTYICLVGSAELALHNLKLICGFVNTCMSPDGLEPVEEIREAVMDYETFCRDDRYRCLTLQPCSRHFKDVGSVVEPRDQNEDRKRQSTIGTGPNRSGLLSTSYPTSPLAEILQPDSLTIPNNHRLLQATVLPSQRLKVNSSRSNELRQDYTEYYNRAIAIYLQVSRKAWSHILLTSETSASFVTPIDTAVALSERNGLMFHSSGAEVNKPSLHDRKQHIGKSKFSELIDERYESIARNAPVFTGPLIVPVDPLHNTHPTSVTEKASYSTGNLETAHFLASTIISTNNGIEALPSETMLSSTPEMSSKKATSAESQADWTINAIELVLGRLGHTIPDVNALYDLAVTDFYLFEKYAAYLARESLGRGRPADDFKRLCDAIYDSLSDGKLTTDSPNIEEFSKFALLHWQERMVQVAHHLPSEILHGGQVQLNNSTKGVISASGATAHSAAISTRSQFEEMQKSRNQNAFHHMINEPRTTSAPSERHQDDIISHIEGFLTDLEDLKRTKTELMHFSNQIVSSTDQFDVFNDVLEGLQQTKEIILGVAGVVAKDRDMYLLEDFLVDTTTTSSNTKERANKGKSRAGTRRA